MRRFSLAIRARIEISPSKIQTCANRPQFDGRSPSDQAFVWENEKNPCFGPSGYGRRIADLRRITINSSSFDDVKRSSGPPVWQNLPGLSHQTGGRRIPNRVRIGLRSGKMRDRGTYRGRIGDGLKPKK